MNQDQDDVSNKNNEKRESSLEAFSEEIEKTKCSDHFIFKSDSLSGGSFPMLLFKFYVLDPKLKLESQITLSIK